MRLIMSIKVPHSTPGRRTAQALGSGLPVFGKALVG